MEGHADSTVRDILVDSTGLRGRRLHTVNGVAGAGWRGVAVDRGGRHRLRRAGRGWVRLHHGPVRDRVLLGGAFTTIGAAPRFFSGSVSTTSGAVTGWAPATVQHLLGARPRH